MFPKLWVRTQNGLWTSFHWAPVGRLECMTMLRISFPNYRRKTYILCFYKWMKYYITYCINVFQVMKNFLLDSASLRIAVMCFMYLTAHPTLVDWVIYLTAEVHYEVFIIAHCNRRDTSKRGFHLHRAVRVPPFSV